MNTFLGWVDSLTPMQVIGVMLLVFVIALVVRWSKREDPVYRNFKLIYMVTNKCGYPDNDKLREWGLYGLMFYGFLWLLWEGNLSEWYVGVFAVLVGGKGAYAMKVRAGQRSELTPDTPPAKRNPLEGSMSG